MIYGVKNLPTKDLSTIYLMELDYKKPEVKRKLKNKIDKNIDLKKKRKQTVFIVTLRVEMTL